MPHSGHLRGGVFMIPPPVLLVFLPQFSYPLAKAHQAQAQHTRQRNKKAKTDHHVWIGGLTSPVNVMDIVLLLISFSLFCTGILGSHS